MPKTSYTGPEPTKHELAASLKRLMAQKPLEKITIREITDGCGMKRQTFYYHFEDIYDLVRWVFQEETLSLLSKHEGVLLWQDGLLQLFQYLGENKTVCLCALKSLGRNHIKRFFQGDIYNIISRTIENVAEQMQLPMPETQEEVEMLMHFYVTALAGIMESWLLGELDRTPEEIVAFVDQVLQDHIRGAVLRHQGIGTSAEAPCFSSRD